MKKLILFLILLIFIISVNAQELPNYYDKYVNDFANLFTNSETQELRTLLYELDQNTTAEVVVVTINTTAPLTPAEYRTKLFDYWHIGKKDKDNGLLILYSLQENRIEVETGYGLEGILPDSKLGRLLDENYVPYRDKKQVNQGIIVFTKEVSKIIKENKQEVSSTNINRFNIFNLFFSLVFNSLPLIFILVFILIIYYGSLSIRNAKKKRICKKDNLEMKYVGLIAGYYIYKCARGHENKIRKTFFRGMGGFSGGGFSGGGFGGGSGGFGGGGFGGGGSGGGGVGR